MGIYERALRPLLFRVDPERIHELAMGSLALAAPLAGRVAAPDGDGRLRVRAMGLDLANPLGLAAGFDKRARAVPTWSALGFGFVEVGTVTALAQPGNPRPRLFRLPADRALINRMGFNNDGAHRIAARLAGWERRGLLRHATVGINLGKSKVTPGEDAPRDYAASLRQLWAYADYVVVNVSSPNTPGLRDLQAVGPLGDIVDALQEVDRDLAAAGGPSRPLLVKIAPDLADADVAAVVAMARDRRVAGVIVANTTLGRGGLASPVGLTEQAGGLSGAPVRARCTELVRQVARQAEGELAVIGVGGVFTADDLWDTLAAGADLVQGYTGFVYGGPGWPRALLRGLLERMDRAGIEEVSQIPRLL